MAMTADEMFAKARDLRAQADALSKEAQALHRSELAAKPLLDRLIFAATARCECGVGMAYDPAALGPGPFRGPTQWECSAILLYQTASPDEQAKIKAAAHTSPLPFAFYEVKSERTPSAGAATTRPSAP